jgi:hypothetical protein
VSWAADRAAYNLRQLRLAARAIDDYCESPRSLADLGALVQTLEALEAVLESPDERWATRFSDDILGLETVYATRLDRGGELDDEGARVVGDAIVTLRRLVQSGVEANGPLEDSPPL